MSENPSPLKCRTCGKSFVCKKRADGAWHTEFMKRPPAIACKLHIGSALCRWETHKQRLKLWQKVSPYFGKGPAVHLTIVPPQRLVAFDKLSKLNLENERRAMRRWLRNKLPKGTVLVSIFDISLVDDLIVGKRVRYWMPHFHILIAGTTALEFRKLSGTDYKGTDKVRRPVYVRDAPTPRNALGYALKHIDDIKAKTIFRIASGSGNRGSRQRMLKADERALVENFVWHNPISTYSYFMGFRKLELK